MTTDETGQHLFLGDEVSSDIELLRTSICVRSYRSPEKATSNEDAAAVIPVCGEAIVFAVADGVGGSPGGREASELAVTHLRDALTAPDMSIDRLRPVILDAVESANRALLEKGRAATTLVIGELVGRELRSYHIGDSELIAVGQRGSVKARIIPHSPTGFAVEAGLLGENEAVQHEQRHVLFNVIGATDMRVDIATPVRLAQLDTVLLASDGLVDNLYFDEIVDLIRIGPLSHCADRLVAAARRRMSAESGTKPSKPDDLTVILFRGRPAKKRGRRRQRDAKKSES